MSNRNVAILLTEADGTVIAQSRAARLLLGDRVGDPCRDVIGSVADGAPCGEACVRRLLRGGLDASRQATVKIGCRRHALCCMPVDGKVVCSLNAVGGGEVHAELSPRERDVLERLAVGETTAAVATALGIAPATVRTHVEKLRSKLGVASRAAIVAKGFQLGYLS